MRLVLPGLMFALLLTMGLCPANAQHVLKLAQAPSDTTPAEQKLVGIAAWNTLVGNSITGKEDDEILVEYYASDGTAKSMLGNEISTGKWALVGDTICFQYPDQNEMLQAGSNG